MDQRRRERATNLFICIMIATVGVSTHFALLNGKAAPQKAKVVGERSKETSRETMLSELEKIELEELRKEKGVAAEKEMEELVSVIVPHKGADANYYMEKYSSFKGVVRREDTELEIVISTLERQEKAEMLAKGIKDLLGVIGKGGYGVVRKVWIAEDYSEITIRVDMGDQDKYSNVRELVIEVLVDSVSEYRAMSDKGGYEVVLTVKDDATDEIIERTEYPKE